REPFYDYATAGLMAFLGPSFLAGRLTSVFLSLILIAGTYAWASRAFGQRTALLTAAGLAVSFWAVMTARQALRSITLPALLVLAVFYFWRAVELARGVGSGGRPAGSFLRRPATWRFALAGLLLGITLYTYVPARVLWLLFPALLVLLFFYDRRQLEAAWRGALLTLASAAAVAIPLVLYLTANPGVEARLSELSVPLTAARQGDFGPLVENIAASSLLLTFEGDSYWRYNIPGRPFLSPIMAGLFFAGLIVGLYWIVAGSRLPGGGRLSAAGRLPRQVGFLFSVLWLLLGLSPALVSGPELSTTRAIGLQPVLYVFPAMTLTAFLAWRRLPQKLSLALVILLFAGLYLQTGRDYFFIWANEPEVRVQYETSLVETLDYVGRHDDSAMAISTTTPNRYHSPAVATLTLADADNELRWFDGNHSLLAPQEEKSSLVFSGFAPVNPHLAGYLDGGPVDQLPTRDSDLDRPLVVYETNGRELAEMWSVRFDDSLVAPAGVEAPVQLGESVQYLGYEILTPDAGPGGALQLATLWRVVRPLEGAVLFSHVLGPDGMPLAQADRLDAPGDQWVAGDVFIQLHEIYLPASLAPGDYPVAIGAYTDRDMVRLPVIIGGQVSGDHLLLPALNIDS
ncbi:MAG: hypothetical protein JSW55_16150, partial [Chloroflexota bacterium]